MIRLQRTLPVLFQRSVQVTKCAQGGQISRWRVNPGQYIDHVPISGTHVAGNVAVQRPRRHVAVAEVDANGRHWPHCLPGCFKIGVDKGAHVRTREQHGPRQACVGSAQPLIEPSHHLEQQHRLVRLFTGRTGSCEIAMPPHEARCHTLPGLIRLRRRHRPRLFIPRWRTAGNESKCRPGSYRSTHKLPSINVNLHDDLLKMAPIES